MVSLPDNSAPSREPELRRLEDEASRLDRDLREFARDMESRLDDRVRELKALIERADETIARLESRVEGDVSSSSQALEDTPDGAGSREERVSLLAESGLKTEAIAGRLGLPIGEVELILSLERRSDVPSPRSDDDSVSRRAGR